MELSHSQCNSPQLSPPRQPHSFTPLSKAPAPPAELEGSVRHAQDAEVPGAAGFGARTPNPISMTCAPRSTQSPNAAPRKGWSHQVPWSRAAGVSLEQNQRQMESPSCTRRHREFGAVPGLLHRMLKALLTRGGWVNGKSRRGE